MSSVFAFSFNTSSLDTISLDTMQSGSLLSLMVFLPLVGALLLYALPFFSPKRDGEGERARWGGVLVSLLTFCLSLLLLAQFDGGSDRLQFVERYDWIPSFGISYFLGVDGISLFLVLLTTFLMPLVLFASWSVKTARRGYIASMLLLQTAMLGTLVSLDIFLFYVFWELMLAPMYFIIGIWGGSRRVYATLKFVLYTVAGSLLMLVAIFYLVWQHYEQTGVVSFALDRLLSATRMSLQEELWLFAACALAFGIKVPIFPFHTWLPDAHVEAPTGGSVVLAGVLLKMGLYGFLRFGYPLFPRAAELFAPYIGVLAVIGIIYGALLAWAQDDIKKLVAYSSVSHLGYCVLGLVAFNVMSLSGTVFQMLSHGISTGALFFLVGALYERRHTRKIAEYGGLAGKVPLFAALFLVFTLSSIALPLTNGFVGELLILLGSFQSEQFRVLACIAVLGVVLGAVYMLTLYLRTMFGPLDEQKNGGLADLSMREVAVFAPLVVMVFWMGIYPQPILSRMEPTLSSYIAAVNVRRSMLSSPRRIDVPGDPSFAYQGGVLHPVSSAEPDVFEQAAQREPHAGRCMYVPLRRSMSL